MTLDMQGWGTWLALSAACVGRTLSSSIEMYCQ